MRPLPDGVLAREATFLVERVLSPDVFRHSLRAFLLAREYAGKRDIAHDEEGLFLASLFHDLGLSDAHRDGRRAFTEIGADALVAFLEERGEGARGSPLAEAIELHMQLFPRWSRGPEVGLLQVGAWMDVVGLRGSAVGKIARRGIEDLYPRGRFTTAFHARLLRSLGSPRACLRLLFPRHDRGSSQ